MFFRLSVRVKSGTGSRTSHTAPVIERSRGASPYISLMRNTRRPTMNSPVSNPRGPACESTVFARLRGEASCRSTDWLHPFFSECIRRAVEQKGAPILFYISFRFHKNHCSEVKHRFIKDIRNLKTDHHSFMVDSLWSSCSSCS